MENDKRSILIIGACCLDRTVSVSSFPLPDSKIRSNSTYECGGGNAANTASAMSLLLTASAASPFTVRLLTKLGDDAISKQLRDELTSYGVQTPLFCRTPSTTSVTMVIVSEDTNQRCCIHTKGSCGDITQEELTEGVMDTLLRDILHFHSDTRHTHAAYILAVEAKRRGITISVDVEKVRDSEYFEKLLDLADVVFTNEGFVTKRSSRVMPDFLSLVEGQYRAFVEVALFAHSLDNVDLSDSTSKEYVVTRGDRGALHIQRLRRRCISECSVESAITAEYSLNDKTVSICYSTQHFQRYRLMEDAYKITDIGISRDVAQVVDTTGAGDAFIAGYLFARLFRREDISFCLMMASWVAGKKVRGPGARGSLPRGVEVNRLLGLNWTDVRRSLEPLFVDPVESSEITLSI